MHRQGVAEQTLRRPARVQSVPRRRETALADALLHQADRQRRIAI